jgi:hypothetical protein
MYESRAERDAAQQSFNVLYRINVYPKGDVQ